MLVRYTISFNISFVLKRSSNWIFAFLEFYEISCQILFSKMHLFFQCLESVYLWNNGVCTGSLFWRKRKHCVKDNSRFWGRKMRKSASKVEKPKRSYKIQGYINRYILIHCGHKKNLCIWKILFSKELSWVRIWMLCRRSHSHSQKRLHRSDVCWRSERFQSIPQQWRQQHPFNRNQGMPI